MQTQPKPFVQDDYCRICGTVLSCNRIHIFFIEPTMRKKMLKLLPFQISKEDRLPKDCCYKCIDTLKHFITFIDKSWYIQKTFLKKISKDDTEPNEQVEIQLPNRWYTNSSEDQETEETPDKRRKKSLGNLQSNRIDTSDNGNEKSNEHCTDSTIKDTDKALSSNINEQTNHDRRSSQEVNPSKQKLKYKRKYKRNNPFVTRKRYAEKRKYRRKKSNLKKLIADKEEQYAKQLVGHCQLVVNGKVNLVAKPPTLKGLDFIMSSLPGGIMIYCCRNCEVIYTSEAAAMKHDCKNDKNASHLKKTDESSPPYTCEICDLTFPRRVALEHHMSSHILSENSLSDEDELPQPKARKRRVPSDSSVEIEMDCPTPDTSESSIASEDSRSGVNSDNFVVDDDTIEYEDDRQSSRERETITVTKRKRGRPSKKKKEAKKGTDFLI